MIVSGSPSGASASLSQAKAEEFPSSVVCPTEGPEISSAPVVDFASFYRATLAPLRRYLSRLLGSQVEAQDLAQDAYVRVYSAMADQTVHRPQAFLYTAARRLALNELKRRTFAPVRLAGEQAVDDSPSESPGVTQIVMAREEWERLGEAVADLPEGCRNVLLLSRVERLSHSEIAKRLGISVNTVKTQLARAIRLLRSSFQSRLACDREQSPVTSRPPVSSAKLSELSE